MIRIDQGIDYGGTEQKCRGRVMGKGRGMGHRIAEQRQKMAVKMEQLKIE